MALGDDLNLGLVSLVKQGMLDNAPKNLGGIYGTDLTEAERSANIQDISKAEGWSMNNQDICTCLETKKECPYIEKIYVVI